LKYEKQKIIPKIFSIFLLNPFGYDAKDLNHKNHILTMELNQHLLFCLS